MNKLINWFSRHKKYDNLLKGVNKEPVSLNKYEPIPKRNDLPAVWDLVIADMKKRDNIGKAKYLTRLQPFNGRSFLVDAYQEALDLVVYLRGLIYEDEHK